jgi:general secretion pathway protein G
MKKGFTMVELVFVIVIIGILAGVALPKMLDSKGQADIAKGKATLYSVRGSLSAEKQNRFMNGDSTSITDLSGVSGYAFHSFSADKDGVKHKVLEYGVKSCTKSGCWNKTDSGYVFYLPDGGSCTYILSNGTLDGSCPELGD